MRRYATLPWIGRPLIHGLKSMATIVCRYATGIGLPLPSSLRDTGWAAAAVAA